MQTEVLKEVVSIVVYGWLGTFLVTGVLIAAISLLSRIPIVTSKRTALHDA